MLYRTAWFEDNKNKNDIKALIKKFYFSFLSYKAYKNRRILKNPNIIKILFFETTYDNMYHFIFQYYPSLLALIEFCKINSLDYYIIMPPKCNRGLNVRSFYRGFIDDLIKIEKIKKKKMIFIDYQNYEVANLYHTNFPSENPDIQLRALKKNSKSPIEYKKINKGGGVEFILVEKKQRDAF